MWVWTTAGFVSAVQHRDNHDNLMVRARDEDSLKNMLASIDLAGKALAEDGADVAVDTDLKIVTSGKGDYRHRVTMSKSTFALFLQFEVLNYLSYPNFKSELAKFRGPEFTTAAHRVWDNMQLVSDGEQVYGSVGVGGKRVAKKYSAASGAVGGFVGSSFFEGGDGYGYHGFNDGTFADEAEPEPTYKDQLSEAEAAFDVLPKGSEDWTEEEFDAYLDGLAHAGNDEVTVGTFLEGTLAKPAPKAVAKSVTPKTVAAKKAGRK